MRRDVLVRCDVRVRCDGSCAIRCSCAVRRFVRNAMFVRAPRSTILFPRAAVRVFVYNVTVRALEEHTSPFPYGAAFCVFCFSRCCG